MEKENHVLVVFPHPDDEAFGVSGTLSKYRDMGVPVTYSCLTYGDMGRNLGFPPFATRESLYKIRAAEVQESARLIGIEDMRLPGFRDKTLEFEEPGVLTNLIRDMIVELGTTRIISFYPGYSVHPDHEATAEAVIEAVASLDADKRPSLQLVAFANNTFDDLGEPDIVVNIEGYEERKKQIMAAHKSQTGPLLESLAADTQDAKELADQWLKYERFFSYTV